MITPNAATSGRSRFSTEGPAVPSRSTGWAGAEWMVRTDGEPGFPAVSSASGWDATFDAAFRDVPHTICYSVKANSTQSVLRTFINLGGGVDIVSGGELYRALKAGVSPAKVVYSGVGKKDDAFAWLEKAYQSRSQELIYSLRTDPAFDALRSDPRYADLVHRIGFLPQAQ